ncbi:MAG TPA: hypothetical protein VFJ16_00385 [Longimicrobium sp.]|nr:hypothetical protein [Longimicrobium sp.]
MRMRIVRKRPPRRLVYVQISPQRILLRRVATGDVVDDVPQIAIDSSGAAVAFGRAATDADQWRADLRVVNGFEHPRCLVGDMDIATRTLRWALDQLLNPRGRRRWRRAKPDLVLHPVGVRDLSGLEAWGLQRIAELAGAGTARLWLGEEPPYEMLISGTANGAGSFHALAPGMKGRKKPK